MVCIFILRLSARPFSGLVGEADFPPISLHPPSGAAGICPLWDYLVLQDVKSNTLDICFLWILIRVRSGQYFEGFSFEGPFDGLLLPTFSEGVPT